MRKIFKVGDYFVIALILIITFVIALIPVFSAPEFAVIYVNGQEFGRYNLKDLALKKIEVSTEYGNNTVVIENSAVKVTKSSCEDKIEMISGSISRTGQSLICLPNRLVIKIEGGANQDATTF